MKIFDPQLTGSIEVKNPISGSVTTLGNIIALGSDSSLSGSFSGSFSGDGAGITGAGWDGQFTGSAIISGSLNIVGDTEITISSSLRAEYFGVWSGSYAGYLAPSGELEGNTTNDLGLGSETGKNIRFYTNKNTTEKMRLTTDGNLGIGIAPSSTTSLHIYKSDPILLIQASNTSGDAELQFFPRDGSNVAHLQSIKGNGSNLVFSTGGNSGNSYVPTEALTISSGGLATFSNDIELSRAARTTIYASSTNQGVQLKSNGSGVLQLNADGGGNVTIAENGGLVSTADLKVDGSFNSNGNATMYINGAAAADPSWIYWQQGSNLRWLSGLEGNSTDFWFLSYGASGNGMPRLVLKENGNVGIGTDNPSSKLGITATRTAQLTLIELSTNTLASAVDDEISIDFGRGLLDKYSARISGYISNFSTYDGGLKFYTSSGGTLNTTPQLTISSGGEAQFTSVKGSGESLNVKILDSNTNYAQGTGGGLLFQGVFQNNGNIAGGGAIQISKANSTNGDYSYDMDFYTRPLGSALAKRLTISSGGDVTMSKSEGWRFISSGLNETYISNQSAWNAGNSNTLVFAGRYRSSANDATALGEVRVVKEQTTNDGFYGGEMSFWTRVNGGSMTKKLGITSGGVTSVNGSNAGTVFGVTNTSTTTPYGVSINMSSGGNNTSQYFIGCGDGTQGRFYVWSNGNVQNTNNSYGAISDIKLKENISDATPKLNDLLTVKIRNYNLIGDDIKQIGVIAQELEEIFPSMVEESPDTEDREVTDEEGNVTTEIVDLGTTTKSVKYSVFTPMLIKAIQEQQTQIEELKSEIQLLKNN